MIKGPLFSVCIGHLFLSFKSSTKKSKKHQSFCNGDFETRGIGEPATNGDSPLVLGYTKFIPRWNWHFRIWNSMVGRIKFTFGRPGLFSGAFALSFREGTTTPHTVDWRNPAPVDMVNRLLFTVFHACSVVSPRDFWTINSRNHSEPGGTLQMVS